MNKVGLFNEKLSVCEDYDLWLKLANYGYKIRFIDELLGTYRIHQSSESSNVSKNIKAIVVGGGSFIIPKKLDGVDLIKFPEFGEVANAIGSSMAQISGYSEKVFSTTDLSRNEIIKISKNEAVQNAIKKGADQNTVEIIDLEEIPLSYLPSNAITIKTRAVGNIKSELN